jgi:hypothetical protein
MSMTTKNESPFAPNRAFVVQVHMDTDLERGDCVGRLEHVVSGKIAHFQSCEELLAAMARILVSECPHPSRSKLT